MVLGERLVSYERGTPALTRKFRVQGYLAREGLGVVGREDHKGGHALLDVADDEIDLSLLEYLAHKKQPPSRTLP